MHTHASIHSGIVSVFGSAMPTASCGALAQFCQTLAAAGFRLQIEGAFADFIERGGGRLPVCARFKGDLPAEVGVAVSVGGDGTFLRTARRIGCGPVPIVGVNAGHLGFLTQYDLSEADLLARHLRTHALIPEQRILLKISGPDLPADVWPYVLNEVAVSKEDTSSMIDIEVYDRGDPVADYQADGLVISTPTGSTAYSLSAGGPLVSPDMKCILLVPVAPHTLTLRPMVIGADSVLTLAIRARSRQSRVSLDGCSFALAQPGSLSISLAPFTLTVLKRPGESFYATLRKKLHWAQR